MPIRPGATSPVARCHSAASSPGPRCLRPTGRRRGSTCARPRPRRVPECTECAATTPPPRCCATSGRSSPTRRSGAQRVEVIAIAEFEKALPGHTFPLQRRRSSPPPPPPPSRPPESPPPSLGGGPRGEQLLGHPGLGLVTVVEILAERADHR